MSTSNVLAIDCNSSEMTVDVVGLGSVIVVVEDDVMVVIVRVAVDI